MLISASFTDNDWATARGFTFLPGEFSIEAYRYIALRWSTVGHAYLMTIVVTFIGTSLSLFISVLFAYEINRQDIPGMKVVSFLLVFTMLFNGGLVSTYYCYTKPIHIKDTIWALIIPGYLMNAFNVILLRNYFVKTDHCHSWAYDRIKLLE